ncbi:RNA polymerase sigma factor [Maricaulis maris]|uniref:RNA polymerase sigma factor n=1 Tax=Maricaulis maris TaxID=74318 RepID=A0A495D1Z6_9PROT|nr:sigma-70 family RNA polymerase sigma factor [Maricaulis maris]RKQ95566.1 RNA polymerase RpoE-like sigma-24 subunit [Maricaulis maris]
MRSQPTDAALVAAARSGNDAAYGRIVDRYQGAIRTFLCRLCPYDADADDLAQETFLAGWTELRRLRDPERLKTWLFSIAWRKAKGQARSMARARQRDDDWQDLRPDSETPQTERAIALRQALGQLPPDQRAAVSLCLGEGWSHGDAANVLEMPLGTVKSHVLRGRARLAEILGVGDGQD